MNRSLLRKCVGEAQWLWLACAAALYAFCWVRVWIVSQFEMIRFQAVLEQFREYEKFSPVPFDQLFTYPGRIALTFDEPVVILCMTVWAIARGSDCVSGEIGRGTMEMLLAQPISRLRILATHSLVTVVGAAGLATIVWLGVATGVHTTQVEEQVPAQFRVLGMEFNNPFGEPETVVVPMRDKADPVVFAPAAFNLFSLTFCLAGLTTLLSSWDRHRWRTIGLIVGIFVGQTVLKVLGVTVGRFAWVLNFTFFTAYEPESFVSIAVNHPEHAWSVWMHADGRDLGFGPLVYDLVLLGLGLGSYLLAAVIFSRRDLPAPL